MSKAVKHRKKLVREGRYVAEVEVDLIDSGTGWSPSLTLEDASKLDDVQQALRTGDINAAARLSKIFSLTPVSVHN